MAYISFALTRPVPDEWQGLSQEENDAKTAAILDAVAKNGGDIKVTAFSGDHMALVSVIEYPDEMSGRRPWPTSSRSAPWSSSATTVCGTWASGRQCSARRRAPDRQRFVEPRDQHSRLGVC